jgi:cell division septation protein DedD
LPTSKKIDADGTKQAIEVVLKKAPESYYGYVFDEQEAPLEGVLVRATNMESQKKVEVYSDAAGKFSLPIEAKKDYLLLLSKAKYINLNINRNDIDAKNMALGAVRMKLATNEYENISTIKDPGTATVEKFTVQLAAVRGKNTDLKPYQTALKDVGEVFMTESGNDVYKIKVGKFKTREEAVTALKKVEAAGYKGMITTGIKGGTDKTPIAPPIAAVQYSNYHVRLTTLSKPENFEMAKVEKIAKVTSMKSGALTIFLLSNFKTHDDAKHALEMAKTAGFNDAYLVEKAGDKLTKVE